MDENKLYHVLRRPPFVVKVPLHIIRRQEIAGGKKERKRKRKRKREREREREMTFPTKA
jgi:hypothetical protein